LSPYGGGVAQVVEWLPSKHEVLSSNVDTSKKRKKKQMLIDVLAIIGPNWEQPPNVLHWMNGHTN
jgi:hypothetical protein